MILKLLFILMGIVPAVMAETIDGRITAVNHVELKITVAQENQLPSQPSSVDVATSAQTRYQGVAEFAQLKPGDVVKVDAQTNMAGQREARMIAKVDLTAAPGIPTASMAT